MNSNGSRTLAWGSWHHPPHPLFLQSVSHIPQGAQIPSSNAERGSTSRWCYSSPRKKEKNLETYSFAIMENGLTRLTLKHTPKSLLQLQDVCKGRSFPTSQSPYSDVSAMNQPQPPALWQLSSLSLWASKSRGSCGASERKLKLLKS